MPSETEMQKEEKKGKFQNKLSNFFKNVREQRAKRDVSILQRQQAYDKTRTGRFGKAIAKGFTIARSPTNYLNTRGRISPSAQTRYRSAKGYSSVRPRQTAPGVSRGKGPGRPYGTVKYRDPATGQPIGVYEYRKILSARLREQRMNYLNKIAINPRQRQIVAQIEARDRARMENPERQTIPDTSGNIQLGGIFKDIEDATNLVD